MNTTPSPQHGSQADRIFAKFGGVRALAAALSRLEPHCHRTRSALYRWNLPKNKGGSNGMVPSSAQPDIMRAARLEGVHLTAEDWMPSCS